MCSSGLYSQKLREGVLKLRLNFFSVFGTTCLDSTDEKFPLVNHLRREMIVQIDE